MESKDSRTIEYISCTSVKIKEEIKQESDEGDIRNHILKCEENKPETLQDQDDVKTTINTNVKCEYNNFQESEEHAKSDSTPLIADEPPKIETKSESVEDQEDAEYNISKFVKCEYTNAESISIVDMSTSDSTGVRNEMCASPLLDDDNSEAQQSEEEVVKSADLMGNGSLNVSSKSFSKKGKIKYPKGAKPFSCPTCQKSYLKISQHICKVGITNPCDICGKLFATKSSLNAHRRLHAGYSFKCEQCGKCVTSKNSLIAHQQRHLSIKPYVCDFCDKSFVKKNYLEEHRRVHLGIRPYVCKICGKAFTRNTHLAMHMGSHQALFSCDICKKTFTRKGQLVEHQRVHTGVKPYKCDVCGKCYTRKSHLRTHQKTHSESDPDTPPEIDSAS